MPTPVRAGTLHTPCLPSGCVKPCSSARGDRCFQRTCCAVRTGGWLWQAGGHAGRGTLAGRCLKPLPAPDGSSVTGPGVRLSAVVQEWQERHSAAVALGDLAKLRLPFEFQGCLSKLGGHTVEKKPEASPGI